MRAKARPAGRKYEFTKTRASFQRTVGQDHREDVRPVHGAVHLHRQTDAGAAVVAHPEEGHRGDEHRVEPAHGHRLRGGADPDALRQVDGVGDGEPPLDGDDGQGEDGEVGCEDREEAGHLAPGA